MMSSWGGVAGELPSKLCAEEESLGERFFGTMETILPRVGVDARRR